MKLYFKKKIIRLLKKLCEYSGDELLLYKELTAWQDIHDPNAPSVMARPIYPQNKEK